jgi:hypothetical protein
MDDAREAKLTAFLAGTDEAQALFGASVEGPLVDAFDAGWAAGVQWARENTSYVVCADCHRDADRENPDCWRHGYTVYSHPYVWQRNRAQTRDDPA